MTGAAAGDDPASEGTVDDGPQDPEATHDSGDDDRTGGSTGTTGELVGPNLFPDNGRRRIPGILYCLMGCASIMVWVVRSGDDPVLVNLGMAVAGALLVVFGVFSIVAGRRLVVDEEAALAATAVAVQRPMGHASAQMGWRGWLSRPTWRILWYSAEEPPRHRGLAMVDGIDGEVLEILVEENPEVDAPIDWSLDAETP